MRILHIVPSYKPAYIYGGPIESVARLCESLARAGHAVDVFTTTANGKSELDVMPGKQVDIDGVSVTYFSRLTKDPTHISPALWRRLYRRCGEYDVIHIHSWWNILVLAAAMICHKKKAKVIISPRGMLSEYILANSKTGVKKLLHELTGRKQLSEARFHATSQGEYEECVRLIPGWKGFVLPNIITLPDLPLEKSNNVVFTLVFLSRVHPKKGVELLLNAISDLPFRVMLRIAGSGEAAYIAKLKESVNTLGISEMVEWVGWKGREEKFLELVKADLFVLTSFNENFANTVIESLHMGTPVLISEAVGLASFVKEKDLGWVTSLDIDSIKVNLISAFRDKEKRMMINATGRQIIGDAFSEEILIEKYVHAYETL